MDEPRKVQSGYYKETIRGQVGTGDTVKDSSMENIWLAEIQDSGDIVMELLDMNEQPTGYTEQIEASEIGTRFEFMPDYSPGKKNGKEEVANKITALGERHLRQQEYLSAEYEFNNAIKLDEENVRANVGLGNTYLAQGETEKAKEAFAKLAQIDAVLEPENKHIFNECGIKLRKLGMLDQAVNYYHRALQLEQNDENLWFNLGRALFELGKAKEANTAFAQALLLNPNLEDAQAYMTFIKENS